MNCSAEDMTYSVFKPTALIVTMSDFHYTTKLKCKIVNKEDHLKEFSPPSSEKIILH
jgi:hypothetical protein